MKFTTIAATILIAATAASVSSTEGYAKFKYVCQNSEDKLPSCLSDEDYRRRLRSLYTLRTCTINCTNFTCEDGDDEEEPYRRRLYQKASEAMCLSDSNHAQTNVAASSPVDVSSIIGKAEAGAQATVNAAMAGANAAVGNAMTGANAAVGNAMAMSQGTPLY